MAISAEETTKS